jgi:hypothetical protein
MNYPRLGCIPNGRGCSAGSFAPDRVPETKTLPCQRWMVPLLGLAISNSR